MTNARRLRPKPPQPRRLSARPPRPRPPPTPPTMAKTQSSRRERKKMKTTSKHNISVGLHRLLLPVHGHPLPLPTSPWLLRAADPRASSRFALHHLAPSLFVCVHHPKSPLQSV